MRKNSIIVKNFLSIAEMAVTVYEREICSGTCPLALSDIYKVFTNVTPLPIFVNQPVVRCFYLFYITYQAFLFNSVKMTKDLTTEKSGFHPKESLDESDTTKLRQKKLRQQDSYWSWIVCAVGFICIIIVLGCSYCFGIIFPLLLDEFKQGKASTGEYQHGLSEKIRAFYRGEANVPSFPEKRLVFEPIEKKYVYRRTDR